MDAPADGQPQLGRYRVVGRLGDGALGRVLLGEDPMGRRVVMTVVRPELAAGPGFRERFREEVRAAASAPPWFVAAVLDADADAESPWLVTTFVDGPTLHAYLGEHGPLGEAGVSALAIRTADGLAALHGAGLVHRDVRPGTLLLAQDGPRLIGLGVARLLDVAARTGRPITAPEYRSPELAAGAGPVGPASDMFSFGALLGYAANGRSPFAADTPAAALLLVIEADPDLGGLTGPVRDVVAACLTKDPARRPTAGQVAGMLRAADAAAPAPTLTHRMSAPQVVPPGAGFVPAGPGRHEDVAAAPVDLPDATRPVDPAFVGSSWAVAPSGGPSGPVSPQDGAEVGWIDPSAEAPPGEAAPTRRAAMPIVAIVLVGILVGAVLAYAIVRGASATTAAVTAGATPPVVTVPSATGGPTAAGAAGATAVDPTTLGADGPRFTFATPSHNIACRMSRADPSARCDVTSRTWQLPPRPSSCASTWGRGAQVTDTGAATLTCANDTVDEAGATVLPYGRSITFGGIVCISRETGVSCTDTATQHGFVVSRGDDELF